MSSLIDGPGLYLTRNGRKVTIHEIKFPPGYEEGNTCFPAKGSIWKKKNDIGINPPYGIWQLDGKRSIFGDHPLDIISKVQDE